MATVHKIILGGEQWLPFARKKLTALARLGQPYASQAFIMPDGADVRVRLVGNQHYLHINGGEGPVYEFFTSEPIFPTTVSTGEFTGGIESFGVTGSGTSAKPANRKTKPLFSSFLTPDADDPQWTLRDKDYIMATNAEPVKSNFQTFKSWQTQKFAEHTNWPNNASTGLTTSTQGMTAGRNSMANWQSSFRTSALANQFTWLHDEGEDVPPTYYDNTGAKSGMPAYADPDVWARHAAVHEADGRKFFICTDNKGRFQVYPFKHYPITNGRNYVNTYWMGVPPYPAWVTVPSPADTRLNEWMWAFNKDATKAVCCPFNSVQSGLMMVERPTNDAPNIYYTMREADVLLPEEAARLASGAAIYCREDTPGLVEIGIKITVTGDGEMDFTVELSLLRNVYAPTNNRYIFDAAYSLKDKGESELMAWPEDTLVTAEVQMFVAPGDYVEGPIASDLPGSAPIFKFNANLPVGFVVISTNDEGMTPTERLKLQIQANDGAYLTTQGFRDCLGPSPTATGPFDIIRPDNFGTVRTYTRKGISAGTPITTELLGVNPCVPSALPLSGQPAPEGDDVAVTSFVFIRSLELRTMSLWYDLFDYRAGKQERILMAYNEVISTTPQGGLPVGTGPDRATLNTQRVPCSAVPHHAAMVNWLMWLRPDRGFSIHPAGHWAHASGSSESGDVVSAIPTKKDSDGKRTPVRTTHKAIFNKAFGENRDHSYYVAPDVGPLTPDNYREFSAHALGYMGGFKTFGIWITF